jgi:DNA-binding response OmpR family regulator
MLAIREIRISSISGGFMTNKHILVVDDDAQIRTLLLDYLSQAGFRMTAVGDGAAATSFLARENPDLIILDVILPDIDGVSLAREICRTSDVPIIMLTTKSEEIERVIGLEVGADDYVSKPFSLRELLARIKSIFRRIEMITSKAKTIDSLNVKVQFEDWELDFTLRRLTKQDGTEVKLTNAEFNLLAVFIERPKRILSRDQLLEYSRADPSAVFDRSIDYLILRLRRKIETSPRNPKLIRTEHGAGYYFASTVIRL